MWFSIGGHPGFNIPLYPNEQFSDYYLEFEEQETLRRHLLNEDGLLSGETELISENTAVLPLHHQYFDQDAIVLKNLNSEKVTMACKTGPYRIELGFKNFPYLGIWSKPGPSPFICIEPWCGVGSSTNAGSELKDKEGINELRPKQAFERTFSITVW